MKIHHLRNATMILESKDKFILIDPMLSSKSQLPSFASFRHKKAKNPIVELPINSEIILDKVNYSLITHSQTFNLKALQHLDHLDKKGEDFLISKDIPVGTIFKDYAYLNKLGLNMDISIDFWEKQPFFDGHITAVPATHGHGWISKIMANGAGYFIELPNEPSIYISGDTVLTSDVKKAIKEFKPDIVVVAAGNAQVDIGDTILMDMEEIIELINLAPNKVFANHMEALNHCGVTRSILKEKLKKENLLDKVYIPEDGEVIEIMC